MDLPVPGLASSFSSGPMDRHLGRASRPGGVPVACPIGRGTEVNHGHSGTGGHPADLHKCCLGQPHPEPSKQRVAGSNPAWRTCVMSQDIEAGPRTRKKVSGKTKVEVRDKLRELRKELDVGLRPRQ